MLETDAPALRHPDSNRFKRQRSTMSKPVTSEERRLKALLGKIAKLVNEADLVEPASPLVAIPQPISVSLEQAAALLGVATSTLTDFIHSGQLPTLRVGRRILVRLDTLHAFAKDLETDEPSA